MFTLPFITTQYFLTISCPEVTLEVNSKIVRNTSWKRALFTYDSSELCVYSELCLIVIASV